MTYISLQNEGSSCKKVKYIRLLKKVTIAACICFAQIGWVLQKCWLTCCNIGIKRQITQAKSGKAKCKNQTVMNINRLLNVSSNFPRFFGNAVFVRLIVRQNTTSDRFWVDIFYRHVSRKSTQSCEYCRVEFDMDTSSILRWTRWSKALGVA